MSFSAEVKEELAGVMAQSRHCRLAELTAILSYSGAYWQRDSVEMLKMLTENPFLAKKVFTLYKKTFNIKPFVLVRRTRHSHQLTMEVSVPGKWAEEVSQAIKAPGREGLLFPDGALVDGRICQKECCRRSFLRGALLAIGSISDPRKAYHVELVCQNEEKAGQLSELISACMLTPRMVKRTIGRRETFVVYLKEGDQIASLLGLCQASLSLLQYETIRVEKEVANQVNRSVNCEAANIKKTVSAGVRQVKDITYLAEKGQLSLLPEGVWRLAEYRLSCPDATLEELGAMLDPPIGKSGVNHRFRKIHEMAEALRKERSNNDREDN